MVVAWCPKAGKVSQRGCGGLNSDENPVLCEKWICPNYRDIERFLSVFHDVRSAKTGSSGTSMAARRTSPTLPLPLQFLAAWLAVWLGRILQEQIDYLKAENRLLREKLGTKRMQLTNAERRRLATLGKALGRKGLAAVATIASPETILRWYRELVARKYDGSQQRKMGRLGGLLNFYCRKAA